MLFPGAGDRASVPDEKRSPAKRRPGAGIGLRIAAPGAPDFRVIDYRLRVIFPQELLLLLEAAGFRLEGPRQVCIGSPAGIFVPQ